MNKEQEKRFEYKWHDHGDHILTIPNCFEDRIVDDRGTRFILIGKYEKNNL